MRTGSIRAAVAALLLGGAICGNAQPFAEPESGGGACPGYTLVAPISSVDTYLVDMGGQVVCSWASDAPAGNAAYLLENGNLLRTEQVAPRGQRIFDRGGAGGRIREIAPNGEVVWEFTLSNASRRLHHDVEPLPNGNVLVIAWEVISREDAIAAGRDPALLKDGELWADQVLEIRPTPPSGGEIVWVWRVWDHLVQDYSPDRRHYADVAEHPELVDVNYALHGGGADWNHTNAVDYHAELDQIALSIHEFGEVWIIDHSTSTQEAASHTGGRYGRGGDLLYRWGNPRTYRAGTVADQVWFGQHDVQWIEQGQPGSGHLLAFNNGMGRPERIPPFSTVDEIVLPKTAEGGYVLPPPGEAFLPRRPIWRYRAPEFFSANISGAQRLPNGNTLICEGSGGRIFEVTPLGATVWEYVNPYGPLGENGRCTEVFKVRKYAPDSPEIQNLFSSIHP